MTLHLQHRSFPHRPVAIGTFAAEIASTKVPWKTHLALDYLLMSSLVALGGLVVVLPKIAELVMDLWWLTLAFVLAAVLQLVGAILWRTRGARDSRLAVRVCSASLLFHFGIAMVGAAAMEALMHASGPDLSLGRHVVAGAICLAPCLHACLFDAILDDFKKASAWRPVLPSRR